MLSLGRSRAEHAFHPNFPVQERNSVWTYGTGKFGQRHAAAAADQGPLRRADPDPHLQQPAGRSHAERRLRPQRDPVALPQRAQRRGERRRRQRAPLPRHLLRLPLEHDAGPARQDQHQRHRQAGLGARRQRRPGQRGGRLPRAAGHHVGARPPLLLHRRERLQGQSHDGELLQRPGPRQRGADGRRQSEAAERQPARLGQHRLRRQPGRVRRCHDPNGQLFFDIFTPTASSATCRWSTSPTRRSSRCCRGSTASASSMPACRASSKLALADANRHGGAVPVHRQRRQPGGEPDPA